MSQQCVVPNWNQRHQRQDQVVEGEGGNRSPHVHTPMPRPNYEVAELIWENGQLAMNGLSGLLPTGPTKPTWPNRAGDTLESIVHQATWPKQNPANMSSTAGSSAQKRAEAPGQTHVGPGFVKKRVRSEPDRCGRNVSGNVIQEERSACASASATFCKENDATLATWASFESPWSLKTKTSTDEDSACQDGSEKLDDDQERKTKAETCRSHSTRRSRAADVHNQSERRRRDRINEKMKALQKLVPNASKTDKASMLDEVIEYLKQLQAQVNLMSSARNMSIPMPMPMPMPHMMMPSSSFGMHHHPHQQQQIQMSLLARMGMGMGMGVGLGMGMGMHGPVPPHARHPFLVNPMIQSHAQAQATTDAATINSSVPFSNPYCTFLGQPMNMDIYNKMAAMYQQQVNQTTQPTSSPLPSSHVQGGIRTP